jgi:hypothetical protein
VISARRVVFHLASSYPYRELFTAVFGQLLSPRAPARADTG